MPDINQTFTHDVFISYSHTNRIKVQKLIRRLREDHFRVWIDEEELGGGDPLREVLIEGIRNSAHLIICLSPQYIASKWTAFESAVNHQIDPDNSRRRTIPVLIEPCQIPPEYAHLYYSDLTDTDNWEKEYKKTIKNIRRPESIILQNSVPVVQKPDYLSGLWEGVLRLWERIDQFLQKHPIISNLVSGALLTTVIIPLRMFFPELTGDYLSLISAMILLIALVVGLSLRGKPKLFIGSVLVGIVIIFSTLVAGYFWGWGYPERGAAYLIVDVSSHMRGLFQEIGPRINNTAKAMPDDTEVGLMAFGGLYTTSGGCDDIAQLVAPAPKPTSVPQIEKAVEDLTNIQPQGPGTLQEAIVQAIKKLTNRPGIQKIIVITSGVDNSCGVLDRKVLEVVAGYEKVKYELTVLTIGPQSQQDQEILSKFAHRYQPVESVEEVPQTVATVVAAPIRSYYDPYFK